jgi:hypothetical protein
MGKSLIGEYSNTNSIVNIAKFQKDIADYNERQINAQLAIISTQKTQLIQIMNDYLTQKTTKIITTAKLNSLESKIA